MNKYGLVILIACCAVVSTLIVSAVYGEGETESVNTGDWTRLKIVAYAPDVTGFFDPNTGKLYIYDRGECITIRQLSKLGDSMNIVR